MGISIERSRCVRRCEKDFKVMVGKYMNED